MARKKDIPCAACGELMWGGKGVLPPGEATCQPCRAKRRAEVFERTGDKWLAARVLLFERRCPTCGDVFESRPDRVYCDTYCSNIGQIGGVFDRSLKDASAEEHNKASCARRRALIKANGGDLKRHFDRLEIFERDGWICHICKEPVDRSLSGRSPMGASIDHIVPLYDGGEHSRANVALAHLSCNAKRGNTRRGKAKEAEHAYGQQASAL